MAEERAPTSKCVVSKHFTGSKLSSICFLSESMTCNVLQADSISNESKIPLIAAGSWDQSSQNEVSLQLCAEISEDELELRHEFRQVEPIDVELLEIASLPHKGDVNAVKEIRTQASHGLLTASSTGGVYYYRIGNVGSSDPAEPALFEKIVPVYLKFGVSIFVPTTCMDAGIYTSCAVVGSETGQLAWIRLDNSAPVNKIEYEHEIQLPIFSVKMLGCDNIVASTGAAPGHQLQIWDITVSESFPVMSASLKYEFESLLSLETHPSRPEILITGSSDGSVYFWDQRQLHHPFQTESLHKSAVTGLRLHPTFPDYLFSTSADANVLRWNFEAQPIQSAENRRNMASACSPVTSSILSDYLPWSALDIHAETDTLIASSDAQYLAIARNCSSKYL